MGYSPWSHKEFYTTEQLTLLLFFKPAFSHRIIPLLPPQSPVSRLPFPSPSLPSLNSIQLRNVNHAFAWYTLCCFLLGDALAPPPAFSISRKRECSWPQHIPPCPSAVSHLPLPSHRRPPHHHCHHAIPSQSASSSGTRATSVLQAPWSIWSQTRSIGERNTYMYPGLTEA